MKSANTHKNRSILKDFILPILVWAGMIVFFLNIKHIPYDFSEKEGVVARLMAKFLATIVLPFVLIHLLYRKKSDFGIYFPKYSESFKLSAKAFSLAGPACLSFLLIGVLGFGFDDWKGASVLSIAFLAVFYFVPKVTGKLPTRSSIDTPNNKIIPLVLLSGLTILLVYGTYYSVPILWKIFYYVFIVGFGEEFFFRGYLQSSMNRYFGKSYAIGNVKFGWGLVLAAVLFGLSHAIVTIPPTWPWAIWTFILGLTLGFIREKDGSILAAVILHAMVDFPLVFFTV